MCTFLLGKPTEQRKAAGENEVSFRVAFYQMFVR